jgi:asparagine synthase (glutamine-hydrolysing)
VPFLDYRLVEFVFALPARLKLRNGETKWVLRHALADVLPPTVARRQDKMGFATPETVWFRTTLREPMEIVFRSQSFRQRPYWQPDEVMRLFQAHAAGQAEHRLLLWRFLNAELWLQHFVDHRPVEPI